MILSILLGVGGVVRYYHDVKNLADGSKCKIYNRTVPKA